MIGILMKNGGLIKKREHYAPAEFLGKSQREMRLRQYRNLQQ